ncbi:hypothetical protein Brms1b_010691 [Colletotrichum noveboracense]|nr:hypothetical protein CBS470a_013496 [Colletotrichum nupharicola]KAJ0305710.1 hypothetical protein Brms1b_010691 [Colletotrichum noveboracense]
MNTAKSQSVVATTTVEGNLHVVDDVQLSAATALPPITFTTDSQMSVHNDTRSTLAVDATASAGMQDTFPKEDLKPGQTDTRTIKTSATKAYFDTQFNGTHTIKTLISDLSPTDFDDGKVAVMASPTMAPGVPGGVKYFFDFFFGPGTLTPLLNATIQNNLPVIIDHIKEKGLVLNALVDIKNITVGTKDARVSYAEISSYTPTSAHLNVVLRLNNAARLTVSILSSPQVFETTDLALMVKLDVDLAAKSVQVAALNISLGMIKLPATIFGILNFVGLDLSAVQQLKNAYRDPAEFAAVINESSGFVNRFILDKINTALKGTKIPFPEDLTFPGPFLAPNGPPQDGPFAAVLTDPNMQSKSPAVSCT